MGKGGTRFVGDAVSVRGKSKGYTSRDQKKASTHVHPPARACLLPAPKVSWLPHSIIISV